MRMYARLFCLCLWIQSVLKLGCCNLYSKFKEFDELRPDNFTVVVKRDTMAGRVYFKIVTFFALRKYFVLHLFPGSPVLREDFQANAVDAFGRITRVHVDQQMFYTGYLYGNPEYSVDAVYTDDVWIAQIQAADDVYSIEPLTHHISDSPVTSMLIFRQRDINSSIHKNPRTENTTLHPFCEEVHFEQYPFSDSKGVTLRHYNNKNNSPETSRHKRKIRSHKNGSDEHTTNSSFKQNLRSEKNAYKDNYLKNQYLKNHNHWKRSDNNSINRMYDTCEMLVIADFETYKGIGRRNMHRMISILVYLYQSIDRIYRETKFDKLSNLGIAIAQLIVHTEYTNISKHYNMPNNTMTGIATFYALLAASDLNNYCLVHLTTQRNFAGTLGVAFTAEKRGDIWGNGICARYMMENRNVGVSTPVNAKGESLPVIVYLLVIAHEIGHNWGSHHDPADNPECSPTSDNGGKYIMWAYSGHAASFNARKFSPCSRQEMAKALNAKAHRCFMPRRLAEKVCGNKIVEPEEDCDIGYLRNDPCCNNCRFQINAVCSPFNHPCCTSSCQIAPRTQKCFVDVDDCHEAAFCTGTESHTCPETKLLPNNSTCQSQGKCWQGKCVSFCEMLGVSLSPARRLIECTCDKDRTSMCLHCCWDPENPKVCTKMGGSKKDGIPCTLGICEKGVCVTPKSTDDFLSDHKKEIPSGANDIHKLGYLDTALQTVTALYLCSLMLHC